MLPESAEQSPKGNKVEIKISGIGNTLIFAI